MRGHDLVQGGRVLVRCIVRAAKMDSLGISIGADTYEYPLLEELAGELEIRHVMVGNETVRYEEEDYCPDGIIADTDLGETVEYHGETYQRVWDSGYLRVYGTIGE